MVSVQHTLCMLQVERVGRLLVPWQRDDSLEICQLYLILRGLRVIIVEALHLLLEDFPDIVFPLLLLCLSPQLLLLRRHVVTSQLLTYVPHLLLEEVLTLLLVDILLRLALYAQLEVHELYLTVEYAQEVEDTLLHSPRLEYLHLVVEREREVCRYEVDSEDIVLHGAHRHGRFVREVIILVYILLHLASESGHRGVKLMVVLGENLRLVAYPARYERMLGDDILKLAAPQTLYYRCLLVARDRHVNNFHYACVHTRPIEVRQLWLLRLHLLLAEDGEYGVPSVRHFLYETHALLPSYHDRAYHAREHDDVPGGEDGQDAIIVYVEKALYISLIVCNHLYL